MTAARVALRLLLAGAMGWLAARTLGAVAGIGAAAVVPAWLRRRASGAVEGHVDDDLASILELAARGARSGLSLPQALRDAAIGVGGTAAALIDELLATSRSAPLHTACRTWARAHDHPGVPVVAAAVGVAAAGTGSSARALEAAARTLRHRQAGRSELEAWSTQARVSAVLLATTPLVFGGLALGARGPAVVRLVTRPGAALSIVAGLAVEAAGAGWMLRLVARARDAM